MSTSNPSPSPVDIFFPVIFFSLLGALLFDVIGASIGAVLGTAIGAIVGRRDKELSEEY